MGRHEKGAVRIPQSGDVIPTPQDVIEEATELLRARVEECLLARPVVVVRDLGDGHHMQWTFNRMNTHTITISPETVVGRQE